METLDISPNLKNEILDSASNQENAKEISTRVLIAKRRGKNPVLILTNGKNVVLKRIARTHSIVKNKNLVTTHKS